jgi:hypothetical protein
MIILLHAATTLARTARETWATWQEAQRLRRRMIPGPTED